MNRIALILNKLIGAAGLMGLACVMLMMLHIVADVVGRFLFNMPVEGTITIVSNYYMVILGFMTLAVAEAKDAHISVEVVADLLPKGVQPSLAALTSLVAVVAFGLLTVRGWMEAMNQFESGAALQQGVITIPIWPTYFAVPFGCGLMTIASFWKLTCTILGRPNGLGEPDPEAFHD